MAYQRIGQRHQDNYDRLLGTMKGYGQPGSSPQDRRAQDQARMMSGMGAAAPAVGSGIGGVIGGLAGGALGTLGLPGLGTAAGAGLGMTAGAALGGAGGQLVGGMMDGEADRLTSAQRERDMERQQLIQMLMMMR